ncbi:hypothetical protein VBQ49_25040, partial [Klebsiella pneumoniae]|nr:hypothetical protein [Klebsiella pneumoniae]
NITNTLKGVFLFLPPAKPLPKTGTAIAAPSPVCFMSSVTAPEIQETAIYQRFFYTSLYLSGDPQMMRGQMSVRLKATYLIHSFRVLRNKRTKFPELPLSLRL